MMMAMVMFLRRRRLVVAVALFLTTGVACRNTGRNFIGIEREADYIEIA